MHRPLDGHARVRGVPHDSPEERLGAGPGLVWRPLLRESQTAVAVDRYEYEARVSGTLRPCRGLMETEPRNGSACSDSPRRPGNGDRAPEQPRLLRRTIDLLVDENVMPLASIPQQVGLAASDIEALAGLPEGYFEGRSNVVLFARMRDSSPTRSGQSDQLSTVLPFKAPLKA